LKIGQIAKAAVEGDHRLRSPRPAAERRSRRVRLGLNWKFWSACRGNNAESRAGQTVAVANPSPAV